MLYREICRILGLYIFGFTLALLLPFAIACYLEFSPNPAEAVYPKCAMCFLGTIVVSLTCAVLFYMIGYRSRPLLYRREGIVAVVMIWLITPALAGLPFWLSSTLKDPCQAYFEAASALTTTGATVLIAKNYDTKGNEIPIKYTVPGVITTIYEYYGTVSPIRNPLTGEVIYEGIEAVPKALLFWRGLLQWLGGVGVVVLFVAILPALGIGGKLLFQTEITGPIKEAVTPRIKETAAQLWKIYLILTLIQICVLFIVNPSLSWLDITTIAFSTISTGGLSVKNNSIGAYNDPLMEWVIIIFMILGSINFSLYYFLLKGKIYKFTDPEFILFVAIIVVESIVTVGALIGQTIYLLNDTSIKQTGFHDAVRYGVFQIISAQTSTGFVTANYDLWPYGVQVLLLIATFIGGMSGSTAGGMKVIRQYMIFRIVQYKIESLFRPDNVRTFQIGNRPVDNNSIMMVLSYFAIILSLSVLGTLVYVFDGIDPESALGLVACMINNGGMPFRVAGPLGSCAFMSDFALLFSSLYMILGRLEFFAVIALLIPAFWKQDS